MMTFPVPSTAAEALLMRLKVNGVDYLFGNAGTDFAPVIEAYANAPLKNMPVPEPLVIPHECAAIGMAHGYYLATGRPQAAMVHVNVGLANSVMGLINMASDNIPLFMMAGRTPLTEHERKGARMTPIQYGQEMRDQTGLIRDVVKWDYELRYPEQVASLVDRGMAITKSAPAGPVYLGLPREPLAEPWPDGLAIDNALQAIPTRPAPDPEAVHQAAKWLENAHHPLIICQRGDPGGRLSQVLSDLAAKHAIPVVENFSVQNLLPSAHPMQSGFDAGTWLKDADIVLAIDTEVPWIQRHQSPGKGAKIIHLGVDPLFTRMPARSYQNDLAIMSDPVTGIEALAGAMTGTQNSERFGSIKEKNETRRADARARALKGDGSPMTPAYVAICLSNILGEDGRVFNELGVPAPFMDLKGPNQVISNPYSGGLGWGLPAALGASLAEPSRLNIACVGDGSYIFANPVACHQIAEAHNLPVLIIVMNNGIWNAVRRAARNVYPEGSADKLNVMPLTSLQPMPDFCRIAEASRGYAERVETGNELPGALDRALNVIRKEKRHALLELKVAAPN